MNGHVAVIGGGVIGLCTALACTLRGRPVTVVERNGMERDGCSFQNAGVIVPSHFVPLAAPGMVALALKWMWNPRSPFHVKPRASWELVDWAIKFWRAAGENQVRHAAPLLRDLALASRGCYQDLAGADDDFAFEKSGTLMLCRTQHALDEEARTAGHARELGMAAAVLDAHRTAALDPGARMDIAGSVHYPDDCRLVPERLMASLERRAVRAGVQFEWNAEVKGWRCEGSHVRSLRLADGREIAADAFVICAGAWSAGLARSLGLHLPLQAGAGYSVTLAEPRSSPRLCAMLTEARVAVTPMGGALRFAGTMELAGLNGVFSPARAQALMDAVPRYYPEFSRADFAGVKPWRGLRPCSPDGLPYVGRAARYDNVAVATGHAMLGITLGPITGKLVADIVSGERPKIDITMLSPDRYS